MAATSDAVRYPTAEEYLLIRPLSYLLELCGWARVRAAHEVNLEPLHVTFLSFAAWGGRVSFDRVYHETGLPRYAVSRAAAKLERRGYGEIQPDEDDKRWKRLHITPAGFDCHVRIEAHASMLLMMRFREDGKTFQKKHVRSYFDFSSYIYHAARCLPDPLRVLGPWKFPDPITSEPLVTALQKELMHFLEELQRAAKTVDRRSRSSQEQVTG